jgi:hypothetical protein
MTAMEPALNAGQVTESQGRDMESQGRDMSLLLVDDDKPFLNRLARAM